MKKTRHTEEQIAFAPKQAEMGTLAAEVIRRIRISEQTLCCWKKVYGGLGVDELRRLEAMGKPLSTDPRERVMGAISGGMSRRAAAARLAGRPAEWKTFGE